MYSNVHNDCTDVNVDCVQLPADTARVAEGRTTGEILNGLRKRAGLSIRTLAKAAGYSHGSGVQRFIEPDYDQSLPVSVAHKIADALDGRGDPPISKAEVLILTGIEPRMEVERNDVLAPRYMDLPRDVPVYGTAVGTFSEDENIEQTVVEMSEAIDFFRRPIGLADREGVYGLYVTGESQAPRFKPGEIIFVDPRRPPMIGDDVVVYIRQPEDEGERIVAVLIKELIRSGPTRIELKQLNPFAEFSIDRRKVAMIHRVLTNADLWGGYR